MVKEQRKSVMMLRTRSQMSDTLIELNGSGSSNNNNNNVNIDNDGLLSLKSSLIQPVLDHVDSVCSLKSDHAKMASTSAHMKQIYTSNDDLTLVS